MTTALADHAMEWMKSMQAGSREERVDLLFDYLNTHGQSSYDPSVTQLEHALQTARLAQQESQQPHLVVASLLHDIGHLMIDEHDERRDFLNQDCAHEAVAARALSVFSPRRSLPPYSAMSQPSGCCAPWMRRITRGYRMHRNAALPCKAES